MAFINSLSSSPVSGTDEPDDTVAVGEPNGEYAGANLPEAEIALLTMTVLQVLGYDALRVCERILCRLKRNAMFALVLSILAFIPLKARLYHKPRIAQNGPNAIFYAIR